MRRLLRDICIATMLYSTGTSMAQQWLLQNKLSGNPDLITVRAVSRDVAWFCGNTTVYRTTDGGQHWLQTANVTTTEALSCMAARDDSTAIVGGCVFRSKTATVSGETCHRFRAKTTTRSG